LTTTATGAVALPDGFWAISLEELWRSPAYNIVLPVPREIRGQKCVSLKSRFELNLACRERLPALSSRRPHEFFHRKMPQDDRAQILAVTSPVLVEQEEPVSGNRSSNVNAALLCSLS